MKTRRHGAATCLAVATLLALTSGCGARSVATGEPDRPEIADARDTDSTAAVEPAAVTNDVQAADESAAPEGGSAPGILRAERTLPPLKPELAEVVKLVESGAGEEVVRAYVSASNVPYDLSLEEIVYLRDIGVPDSVIAAMMRRGGELRAQEADAQDLQTNLVAAVDQLKQAFNGNAAAVDTNASAGPAEAANAPPVAAEQGVEPPASAPEPVQQFYSDLTPYGDWYQVPNYGWVWQPSVVVVDRSWVPYRHGGRWLWTDSGWYWCSDYSWGWAPFHYGRWCTYPGLGWCWVPGSVWGPSWVTWRYSDRSIGWAPLPPACGWSSGIGLTWHGGAVDVGFGFGLSASWYTFVPHYAFCYREVGRHSYRGSESHTIYAHSRPVNHFVPGDHHGAINQGIGYQKVASFVRGEVPKASVESLPTNARRPLRADRLERARGGGYVIYKPTSVPASGGRPEAVRAQVKPGGTRTASSVTGVSSRPVRAVPSQTRPGYASRSTQAELERRAGDERPSVIRGSPSVSYGSLPNASSYRSALTPKSPQTRGALNGTTAPGATLGPTRQTMPVPLADPSRNLPSRYLPQSPRNLSPFVPNKSAAETRGVPGLTVPSAPSAPTAPTAPAYNPPTQYQRRSVPTPNYNPVRPSPTYNPSIRTPSTYTPPKSSFERSAPQRSFSPSPAMSAPRPAYSAPSPAMSAPRPAATAPSAAPSTPSANRSGGRGRSQSN